MKWWVIIISISSLGGVDSTSPVFWCEDRPLSWSDFQGRERRSGYAAQTSTMLNMEPEVGPWWTGKGTYSVTCLMNPKKSWVDRSRVSSKLLRHEQLHFDIAEWHARKLRSMVSQEPVTEKEALKAFDKIFKEMEANQDKYDRETNHGLKSQPQEKWENKVRKELVIWERFAIPECNGKGS